MRKYLEIHLGSIIADIRVFQQYPPKASATPYQFSARPMADHGRGCVKTQIPKLVCAQEYFKMSWELAYGFLWTL